MNSYSVLETQRCGAAVEAVVVQGQPGLHEHRSQIAEVRPGSMNLPEQLHWNRRGHAKVKSSSFANAPRPAHSQEALWARRETTTYDWPAQLKVGRRGGGPRDSCTLAHWFAESRKRG